MSFNFLGAASKKTSETDIVIDVQNVSKWFHVQGKGVKKGPSELEAREQDSDTKRNQFQVLNDVSFQVRRGETVGIVGRNGAGKSTLLKIISGMMKADRGAVKIDGQAYSVMGMGVGFQRNLTGVENIHVKGAVMGASSREIGRKIDWIVDFSELGDYINQPIHTYSKGMNSRLAFAVTFAFDPKLLIIDEALSGGDEGFKRKAQARLNEINESGATILLVSHGGAHHKRLCDRSLLIDKGRLITDGPPGVVMTQYKRMMTAAESDVERILDDIRDQDLWAQDDQPAGQSGDDAPEDGRNPDYDPNLRSDSASNTTPRGAEIINAVFLKKAEKTQANLLAIGDRYQFQITARAQEALTNVTFEICIKSESGEELFRTWNDTPSKRAERVKKGAEVKGGFTIRNRLLPGDYYVDVVVRGERDGEAGTLQRCSDSVLFRVVGDGPDCVEGLTDLSR